MALQTFSVTVKPIKHQYAHNHRVTTTYDIEAIDVGTAKWQALDRMGDYSEIVSAVQKPKNQGTWLRVDDDDDGDDVVGGYAYIPSPDELSR